MKFWLIERVGEVDYDEHKGAVVGAETEADARKIASEGLYPRGDCWLFGTSSTCRELSPGEEPGVVISSFNAG